MQCRLLRSRRAALRGHFINTIQTIRWEGKVLFQSVRELWGGRRLDGVKVSPLCFSLETPHFDRKEKLTDAPAQTHGCPRDQFKERVSLPYTLVQVLEASVITLDKSSVSLGTARLSVYQSFSPCFLDDIIFKL